MTNKIGVSQVDFRKQELNALIGLLQ